MVGRLFNDELLKRLDVPKKHLAFCLGSLILPKQMLRAFHDHPEEKIRIQNVYHYLYKFSLERLQKMLRQKEMALLVAFYF